MPSRFGRHQELGPYILLDQLAVGGMAEIYLAKTRGVAGFEKFLCLKVIHPDFAEEDEFIEMLIDEAKLVVGLNHVNIAQIFDLGKDDNTYYIAMEFVDGADLFKIMRNLSEQDVDVPIDVSAYIAQEICTGLDYAHRKRDVQGRPLGIIHRDISPQNILISHWGEVKIIDFGIAKAASRSRKTQAGVIKGKYYYMSPEQAWGDVVDHRSDIFSTGIILYEVLTGQMLYLEEDLTRLMDMVRRAEIPPPTTMRPDVPPQLVNVVMKALAKQPADRWQTANDFQVALTSFLYSYSPDFTPERLARVLKQALGEPAQEEQADAEDVQEVQFDDDDVELRVDDEQIMSRGDFRPARGNSVIFHLDVLMEDEQTHDDRSGGGAGGRDLEQQDEKTMVSSMPMMSMDPGDLIPVPVAPHGATDWDDDAPTTVTTGHVMPPAREPPPEEVQVIASRDLEPVDVRRGGGGPRHDGQGSYGAPDRPAAQPARGGSSPGQVGHRQHRTPSHPGEISRNTPQPPAGSSAGRQPGYGQAPVWSNPPPPAGRPSPGSYPQASPQQPDPRGQDPHHGAHVTGPVAVQTPGRGAEQRRMRNTLADRLAAGPEQPWDPQPVPAQPPHMAAQPPSWQPQGGQPMGQHDPWAAQRGQPSTLPPRQTEPMGAPAPAPAAPVPVPGMPWGPDPVQEMDLVPSPRRRVKVVLALLLVFLFMASSGTIVFYLVQKPVSEEGVIEVVSVPEQAVVTFDGTPLEQRTPVKVKVQDLKGAHQVEVKLANHQPWKEKVSFPAGYARLRVLAVLSPVYGKLVVRTVPPGATLYLENEARGSTPVTVENLVTTGDQTIELRLKGYKPVRRPLKWDGQDLIELDIGLEKSQ